MKATGSVLRMDEKEKHSPKLFDYETIEVKTLVVSVMSMDSEIRITVKINLCPFSI